MATRGFTGYMYVSLEEGERPGTPLVASAGQRYPRLATAPSQVVSLDTTMAQLNTSVQAVNGLLQSALDPQTLATLKQSLAGLEKVTFAWAGPLERVVRRNAADRDGMRP